MTKQKDYSLISNKKTKNSIKKTNIFSFLSIFEENEQFKLYYEANNQRVNLAEISKMLKAEPIIENGWVERFSKEVNKS